MDAWDNYVLLYEGEWVVIGDSPDDGACRPTKEGRAQARKLLNNVYNHLRPYESEIMSDYERIKDTYHYNLPEGERWIRSAAYFCMEYHKQYDVSRLIGISDMMGEVFEIPAESKSDFVFLFGGNEFVAKSFLKDLYEIKKLRNVKASDVVYHYKQRRGRLNDNGGNYQILFNVIGKDGLGLYLKSYPALTRVFRQKS